MNGFKNINDLTLDQNEYCILQGTQYYGNSSFNIKIPKLMTNVTSPRTDPFNRNIFVNAKDCKPVVSSNLYVQNYITVKKSQQCSLQHKISNNDTKTIPSGTGVTCLCMNGNYRDMVIVDSI